MSNAILDALRYIQADAPEEAPPEEIESFTDLLAAINSIFDFIEVAEEEIERGMAKYPKRRQEIFDTFMTHKRSLPLFRDKSLDLFRAHCREIVERVAHDQPMEPATAAEIAAFLSDASLKTPPRREAVALYADAFVKAYGDLLGRDDRTTREVRTLRETMALAADTYLVDEARMAVERSIQKLIEMEVRHA